MTCELDYWLQGKRALDLSTLAATEVALSLFHKALKIAPDYARGFAGLAEATYSRAFFVPLPDRSAALCTKHSFSPSGL